MESRTMPVSHSVSTSITPDTPRHSRSRSSAWTLRSRFWLRKWSVSSCVTRATFSSTARLRSARITNGIVKVSCASCAVVAMVSGSFLVDVIIGRSSALLVSFPSGSQRQLRDTVPNGNVKFSQRHSGLAIDRRIGYVAVAKCASPPLMSVLTELRRVTVPQIRAHKSGKPIVCLTCYHAHTARLLDDHVDLMLVGDSLGMVMHGMENTLGVTLEMMILHGKAVVRGSKRALIVVDMPRL